MEDLPRGLRDGMRTRYSVTRFCCDGVLDPCPCLAGTIGGAKQSHVSGITYDPTTIRHPDINGSHDLDFIISCCDFFDEVVNVNTTAHTSLCFTRAELWTLVVPDRPDKTFVLPTGVKAVFGIFGNARVPTVVADPFGFSAAAFYKVLTDVNGFVDCSDDLSGFTFLGQNDKFLPRFPDGKLIAGFENAFQATVSYS